VVRTRKKVEWQDIVKNFIERTRLEDYDGVLALWAGCDASSIGDVLRRPEGGKRLTAERPWAGQGREC
jgi:hypothetical protein